MVQSYQANCDLSYHISVCCHGKCLVYFIYHVGVSIVVFDTILEINILVFLTNTISHLMKKLQEGRVELLVVLTEILKVLGCVGLCYFGYLTLKLVVAILICRHPELSEKKVKYITSMIAKDKHQSN